MSVCEFSDTTANRFYRSWPNAPTDASSSGSDRPADRFLRGNEKAFDFIDTAGLLPEWQEFRNLDEFHNPGRSS